MAQPYDYSLNIPSPLDAFSQGFNVAAAGQKARYAREDRAAAIAKKESDDAYIEAMFAVPPEERTMEQYLRLGMINPQIAQLAQQQFDSMSEQQQGNALLDATQIHTALRGRLRGEIDFEMVDEIIARRVDATKGNVGLNKMWSDAREIARTDPEGAEAMVLSRIVALPGGKEYYETMSKRSEDARAEALQPGKISEQKAKIKADVVNLNKVLAETGADIDLITAEDQEIMGPTAMAALREMSKTATRLKVAERMEDDLQITKLQNDIRKQNDDFRRAAQEDLSSVKEEVSAMRILNESIDSALDLGSVKAGLLEGKGTRAIDAATGGIEGREYVPTLREDALAFMRKLETIDAQGFLAQVPKMRGSGQLTEAEGLRLTRALGNLSLVQGAESLEDNLKQIQETIVGALKRAEVRYGDFSELEEAAGVIPKELPNLIFVEQTGEWMERPYNITDEQWGGFIEYVNNPNPRQNSNQPTGRFKVGS